MDNGTDLQSAGLGKFNYTKASGVNGSTEQTVYAPRAVRILAPTGRFIQTGVVAIRAIPKSLLIHTVTHAKLKESDRWGAESLQISVQLNLYGLSHPARLSATRIMRRYSLRQQCFMTVKTAVREAWNLKQTTLSVFNGERFKVKICEPLYDERKLHHWELGLVKHG